MNKIVLLFPGGFKPFHDGHLSILKSHIFNIDNVHIDEVKIFISSKDRDFVHADSSLWFLNQIKDNISMLYNVDIIPYISDVPSPIGKCYSIVNNNDTNDKFCLVSSDKDNDLVRKNDFVKSYQKGGKKYNVETGDQTIMINANILPILYNNRYDEYNDKPISASIVRQDIINHNFNLFLTSYQYMLDNKIVTEDVLKEYYNKLLSYIN